ncbi:MAG: MATE family efflux transporter [Flavobacteriales bacterium]|nr:MATE family efflux transporter [Flavobacteriales bacterium]
MATDLINDKTNKVLLSMSVPISIGMLSTFLFQVIDTYFVGKLGANELAALGFASTIYFLVVGLFIGLSVGVSIIIGTAKGANNIKKVNQTAVIALLISLFLAGLFATLGISFVDPIFTLMGADETILPLIKEYIVPLLYGIPLLTTGLVAGGILRATGNIRNPEIIMGIAGIINLGLDYVLIFGRYGFPEMGIKGAALATVYSWVFVLIGMLILLIKDRLLIIDLKETLSNFFTTTKEVGKLGLPTIITQIIAPLTLIYLTFLFAKQTSEAVAAFGVASRIQTLLMIGVLGVSTAITPFIAQNMGANKQSRINKSIVFGGRASTYLGLLVCILLMIFIKPIASIFSEDIQVVHYTSMYFYIVSISYVYYGIFIITSSIFNGLKLPLNSMKIMLAKSIVLTIPLTIVGSYFGVTGIFIGISLSNILAGILAGYEMRKHFKKVNSELVNVNIWQEYKNDIKRIFNLK